MSDQETIDTAAKVGLGALGGSPLVVWFVKRFFRKADEAEAREKAELRGLVGHLMSAKENHRDQLEELKRKVVELDTRLAMREGRYGVEPLTTPGLRPSPAVEAMRAAEAKEPPK